MIIYMIKNMKMINLQTFNDIIQLDKLNVKGDFMRNTFLGYACDILADTYKGLTGTEIIKYCNRFALDYNVEIPVDDIEMLKTTYKPQPIPNKRTALQKNLSVFNEEQQAKIINYLCNLPKFNNNDEIKSLKHKLVVRYSNLLHTDLPQDQTKETEKQLTKYDKALKLYKEAMEKYNNGLYQRNVLDDLRLSLELLLKDLLNNDKTLENQISELGTLLKSKNVSKEIQNLFVKVIDYYSKYQNNHIKHEDLVNPTEIEFIINLTDAMIKFLIKTLAEETNYVM